MHVVNRWSGTVHAVEETYVGKEWGDPLLSGKTYYVTKRHWNDDGTYWNKFHLWEPTEAPVSCKNCLRRRH